MGSIMVVNMGLKSVRCIIFSMDGLKLGSASDPIKTAINDKCVEQNPDEWWDKVCHVMKKAIKDARIKKVDYVTVTASASCLVCIDKNGKALMPALMVSDKRAYDEARELKKMAVFKQVKEQTGLDAASSLMIPKIMWVKKNKPDVFEKTMYFLSPNDYLVYKLCGIAITDYLNAMKYHYIAEKKSYPIDLLDEIGIPLNKLPKVEMTGQNIGCIREDVAGEVGITRDTKVILASYDAICSFIGSGVTEEGESSDVSGTVTVFRTLSRKKEIGKNEEIYNVPFYQDNAMILGGSNNLGGGLVEWVKQCYYQKEEYPYEIMEKDARESQVGAKGLIFLPYLLGERAPIWDDAARGVFLGLERMHTRKDMTRAVFESTGFIDMDFIEAIEKTGVRVNAIRLSGGGARINLIAQIKADILNRDLFVLSEFETTATGAAMIALTGQGVYESIKSAADKFVMIRMIVKPSQENHKKYEYMYHLYKDTYESLKELFARRVKILEKIRDEKEVKIENL